MSEPASTSELPDIPRKKYFTIGEASELCGVTPHVLRFWEQEFRQIKPVRRRGRRLYSPQAVTVIRVFRSLLYERGLTIGDAREYYVREYEDEAITAEMLTLFERAMHLCAKTTPEHLYDQQAFDPLRQALPEFCDFVTELNRLSREELGTGDGTSK